MRHLKLLLLLVMATAFVGCEKPVNNLSEPVIAVTSKTIDGAWELSAWNGEALTEGTYLYVEFDGKERRFDMWDNLGSMYVQHKTGSFTISQDGEERYILTGQYDYGVGDWNNDYVVRMLADGEEMEWSSGEEIMLFKKIDAIPELN